MTDKHTGKYPAWIDDYARSVHQCFMGMVPSGWSTVNFMDMFTLLNGAFIEKLYEAVVILRDRNVPMAEIAKGTSNPSTTLSALLWMCLEYQLAKDKDDEKARAAIDFIVEVLYQQRKTDFFAMDSNIIHDEGEIARILGAVPLAEANPQIARELGKLYNSLASLAFALYRDWFPQEGHEIYGPYDVGNKFGAGHILTIKHFPKYHVPELWPQTKDLPYRDVKVYQVFSGIEFRCELIGMHSIYKGQVIPAQRFYAVEADGKIIHDLEEIKKITDFYASFTFKHAHLYDHLGHEEKKIQFLRWLGFQYNGIFEMAGMSWEPTQKMLDNVKGTPVSEVCHIDDFPDFDTYSASPDFEVYWLKKLYAGAG